MSITIKQKEMSNEFKSAKEIPIGHFMKSKSGCVGMRFDNFVGYTNGSSIRINNTSIRYKDLGKWIVTE